MIDCDPQGPGLDRMLGLERTEGFRWDALCQTTGRLSARALREALPRAGALGVLSWYVGAGAQTLQAFAVREALSAARRGHDLVVVDLPRTPDKLVDEVAARCDRLLVVTVGSVLGVSAAARMRARFADHPDVGLVLRGESVDAADVESAVRLPVAVQMRDQPRLSEALDLGLGPLRSRRGPLARAVASVLGTPVEDLLMSTELVDEAGGLVEEVRSQLARSAGELTPHRVAEALRAAGRPVGDATVLGGLRGACGATRSAPDRSTRCCSSQA